MAWMLTGLLASPVAASAARCVEASHPCAPAPAPLTCCCVNVADAEQTSLTPVIVVVGGPAATGAGGGLIAKAPVMFPHLSEPAPSPPIDRLALFSQLLI